MSPQPPGEQDSAQTTHQVQIPVNHQEIHTIDSEKDEEVTGDTERSKALLSHQQHRRSSCEQQVQSDEDYLKTTDCPHCGNDLSVKNNLKAHMDTHRDRHPDLHHQLNLESPQARLSTSKSIFEEISTSRRLTLARSANRKSPGRPLGRNTTDGYRLFS